jgi:hypothetical protein
MRKVKPLLFAFIALSVLGGLYYYWQKNRTMVSTPPPAASTSPLTMSKKDLGIPEGEIAEAIKNKKWDTLKTFLRDPKKQPIEIETMFSQIIYSLDSNHAVIGDHQQIYPAVTPFLDQPELLTPRGILLISKIFGKLTLSDEQKKLIEAQYKKQRWLEKPAWLDVSMHWSPSFPSTLKTLNGLLVKGRSDLLADYFYNLNRIADKKTLEQQLAIGKKKLKSFPQEQQRFINDQIAGLERKIQSP